MDKPQLMQRLERLSPGQRQLLAHRLGLDVDAPRGVAKGLLAYVSTAGNATPDQAQLQDYLAARLPDYMVPRVLPIEGGMPRTAAGKIDRTALASIRQAAEPESGERPVEARNESEAILSEIWEEVLGVDGVSVTDDFFELGGDSLLSIRILARARQRGLVISPEHFFSHPTIAGQAAAAGTGQTQPGDDAADAGGTAPLMPIQHWFFTHVPVDPQHWNQSLTLSIRDSLLPSVVERALAAVIQHHDGLRLHFPREGTRSVQAVHGPDRPVPLPIVELGTARLDALDAGIDEFANTWHAGLDLLKGPLFRAALIRTPAQVPDRLLLLSHHLLVDAVSWQLLIEDLNSAIGQARRGQSVSLPAKTSSVLSWARHLDGLAGSVDVTGQADWWLKEGAKTTGRLPCDHAPPLGENLVSGAARVDVALGVEDTTTLLSVVPQVYHTRILDVLLAAFARVVGGWVGGEWLQLDLERHGRQPLSDGIDVSRTLGWLTSVFPVWLPCGGDPGEQIKCTKETLRAVPMDGLGHGLLRYQCPDPRTREAMAALPDSEICFNYLGQRGVTGGLLTIEREGIGGERSEQGRRAYLLEVNLWVADGRLESVWYFSERFHHSTTIQRLAQGFIAELGAMIAHCLDPEAGGHTPSDFPLAGLDQGELDNLAALLDESDKQ